MAVAYYLGGRLGMECGRRWLGGKMNADMQDPAPAPPRTQLAIKSPKVPISYRIRLARGCLTVSTWRCCMHANAAAADKGKNNKSQ